MIIDQEEIFSKCFEKWGDSSQFMMLIEECSELIKSCSKDMWRNFPDKPLKERLHNFAEELTDVQLMIDEFIWRYMLQDEVDKIRTEKLERLVNILKLSEVSQKAQGVEAEK